MKKLWLLACIGLLTVPFHLTFAKEMPGQKAYEEYLSCINAAVAKQTGKAGSTKVKDVDKILASCKAERKTALDAMPDKVGQNLIESIERHLSNRKE